MRGASSRLACRAGSGRIRRRCSKVSAVTCSRRCYRLAGCRSRLVTDADGTSQREAFRRFLTTAVSQPVADLVAEELSHKLAVPVRFGFDGLYAHDLAGRAAAFQKLAGRRCGTSRRRWRCPVWWCRNDRRRNDRAGGPGRGADGGPHVVGGGVALRRAVGGPGGDYSRPGAFAPIGEVSLNLQHDRERVDRLAPRRGICG